MTDQERKAMEMALEALESAANNEGNFHDYKYAANALRQALAQPEQEPVAWMHPDGKNYRGFTSPLTTFMRNDWTPLYTAPPSKPFVFLTKEDMPSGDHPMYDTNEFYAGMAWAQTKLKEKNT